MACAVLGLWCDERLSRSEAPNAIGPSERAEHVALAQGRGVPGFDEEFEHLMGHRAIDHPGRIQPVMAQGRDEALGVSVTERGLIDQTCALWPPARGLGHVCLERDCIDKPNA